MPGAGAISVRGRPKKQTKSDALRGTPHPRGTWHVARGTAVAVAVAVAGLGARAGSSSSSSSSSSSRRSEAKKATCCGTGPSRATRARWQMRQMLRQRLPALREYTDLLTPPDAEVLLGADAVPPAGHFMELASVAKAAKAQAEAEAAGRASGGGGAATSSSSSSSAAAAAAAAAAAGGGGVGAQTASPGQSPGRRRTTVAGAGGRPDLSHGPARGGIDAHVRAPGPRQRREHAVGGRLEADVVARVEAPARRRAARRVVREVVGRAGRARKRMLEHEGAANGLFSASTSSSPCCLAMRVPSFVPRLAQESVLPGNVR